MVVDETLKKIKTAIRIKHNKLDEDITDTICACLADLSVAGVDADLNRPLILNAAKLYCKAAYSENTDDAAAYMERYESLKKSLMISSDYKQGVLNE